MYVRHDLSASIKHFERASRHLARGVSSGIRAQQLPVPVTFSRGSGSALWDVDGNRYVDYTLAYGPLILGHSPDALIAAVSEQLRRGSTFGANHPLETELAEAICRTVPSAAMCVFSSTGTEAVQVALRIARAATGRRKVVKFLGHYHGWIDNVNLASYGETGPAPGSGGQDPAAMSSTVVCDWNDIGNLRSALDGDVAAVLMEPINVDGGCLHATDEYLRAGADLIRHNGSVLIFDEVITGFRVSLGGAQEKLGVQPDLTVLGKALGGGFPISAVAGRADIMAVVADGRVAHAGTYNGSAVAVAAALAVVTELERTAPEVYHRLGALIGRLAGILEETTKGTGVPLVVRHDTGVGHAFAGVTAVERYADTLEADTELYRRFTADLLAYGIHLMPKGILYVSTAHTDADLDFTADAIEAAVRPYR
ncbi:aspartate aminotransferase family protein [Micromonospora echinospora]|uniref:aspartate aminotransferase family protein n=1 Tax=Micromonospora echinospora TaxID=1877 RepID=UPI003CEF798C